MRRNANQRNGECGFELRTQPRLLRNRAACKLRDADEDDACQCGRKAVAAAMLYTNVITANRDDVNQIELLQTFCK